MKITTTDDDMTIHVHTEEIPQVQIITVNPGLEADLPYDAPEQEIIVIGEGGESTNFDRAYYEQQLLEAIAALRFFEREDMN